MSIPKRFLSIYLTLLIVWKCYGVDNHIFDPKIFTNRQVAQSRKETIQHQFSFKLPQQNYQLWGQVYQSSGIPQGQDIYDLSKYLKSQSCAYYKSIVTMTPEYIDQLNYTIHQSLFSQKNSQLYVIGSEQDQTNSQKFIEVYELGQKQLRKNRKVNLNETLLDLFKASNVYMQKVQNSIMITDGDSLYRFQDTKQSNLKVQKVQGFNEKVPTEDRIFLGVNSFRYEGKDLLLILYNSNIVVYEYIDEYKVETYLSLEADGEELSFQDVQVDCSSGTMFVLLGNLLRVYNLKNPSTFRDYQLEGDFCSRFYSSKLTLHIICEYHRNTFVGQYSFTPHDGLLLLNRYYNQLKNYRSINYFEGFMVMVAQNQIILSTNAVNRKVLLKLPHQPYTQKFTSFGLESLFPVKQVQTSMKEKSTKNYQRVVSVGQRFVGILGLKKIPAEIWCYMDKAPESGISNILISTQTSQCEQNANKPLLQSACVSLKPLLVSFEPYQIQKKVTLILSVLVVLLVLVVGFLCLGCVFRENLNYNTLLKNIRKKIDQIKASKSKQLKEI